MDRATWSYSAIVAVVLASAVDVFSTKHVDAVWFIMATAGIWALLAIAWLEDKHE